MRKAITILLALLMVLSLMACGGGSQTTPVTEPTQLPDATPEPTPQSAIDALNENERLLFDALSIQTRKVSAQGMRKVSAQGRGRIAKTA